MTWPRNPFSARPRQPGTLRFSFSSCALLALILILGAILVGCAAPAEQPATPDYEATVRLLLPTAEPTEPPTPTAMPTPESPTATSRPTDTPEPTATLRPTYTPRPMPAPAGSGGASEREPAIPFHAHLLDGGELALPETFGTPTLLAFWAPW